jgi:cardiolipin synthase
MRPTYCVNDREFRDSISYLLNGPLVESNQVVELLNGDQVFAAMLDSIRHAQKSVTIEQFIWHSGEISAQFIDALTERANAGVKVKVIVDTIGSFKLRHADVRRMEDAGIKVKLFNPPFALNLSLPFKLFKINRRTHRKLMVVDGKIGFIGGVCLSDQWAGNGGPDHWRDSHFRVEGPVVAQMQGAFAEHWLKARSEVLHGPDYFPELVPAGSMVAQCFHSGPKEGAEQARLSYLLSMAAARKSIRLAHAYFVPGEQAISTLIDARKRGVKVEVIIPAQGDSFAVSGASRAVCGKLLEAGVEFYQYPTLYHCKILIVDDVWCSVGSVNFDEKSFRYNDEANLNVLDRDFAAKLIETFEEDKSHSCPLTLEAYKNRGPFEKFTDFLFGRFHSEL